MRRGRSCGTTLFPYPVFATSTQSSRSNTRDHKRSTCSSFAVNPNASSTAFLMPFNCSSLPLAARIWSCSFRRTCPPGYSPADAHHAPPSREVCGRHSNRPDVKPRLSHDYSASYKSFSQASWGKIIALGRDEYRGKATEPGLIREPQGSG